MNKPLSNDSQPCYLCYQLPIGRYTCKQFQTIKLADLYCENSEDLHTNVIPTIVIPINHYVFNYTPQIVHKYVINKTLHDMFKVKDIE